MCAHNRRLCGFVINARSTECFKLLRHCAADAEIYGLAGLPLGMPTPMPLSRRNTRMPRGHVAQVSEADDGQLS
jgi:hypothetical protein